MTQKRLTESERLVIFQYLLERRIHRTLKKGILTEASKEFSCSISTIKRIWAQAQFTFTRGLPIEVS